MKTVFFNWRTVGGAVFASLTLLLFFSRTIYAHNLPQVTATMPQRGSLSKLELSSGVAKWQKTELLYAAVAGRVEELMVREGDTVREGQELLRLQFKPEEAQRALREIGNNRSQTALDIEDIQLRIGAVERNIEKLEDEDYTPDEVLSYELHQVNLDIRKAREALREMRDEYYDGDNLDRDLENAQIDLQKLYLQQEELMQRIEKEQSDAEKKAKESEKNREKQLADYAADLEALQLELKSQNLKQAGYSLQEEPYRKSLEDFENYAVIKAPADGIVTKLETQQGAAVTADQFLVGIGLGGEFEVECSLPLGNNFVAAGDKCTLTNPSHRLEGNVVRVEPDDQQKKIVISVTSNEVSAGETFDIRFEKKGETSYTLVPNGSLNKDNNGYFLYQIKKRDGILGNEYYVDRLSVYIGDSDSNNTAIVQGMSFFEPVVLLSDKGLAAGTAVVVKNEEDLLEK